MDYRTRRERAALALLRVALTPGPDGQPVAEPVALEVLTVALDELATLRQQAVEPVHILN
jgi:hypothetical protein